jgi:uncharacterized protein YuzE
MQDRYLEITFRKGKPFAAYIYLSRMTGSTVSTTKKFTEGIIADFDNENNVIGLEITSPAQTPISAINDVLHQLHVSPISEQELAPLKAA